VCLCVRIFAMPSLVMVFKLGVVGGGCNHSSEARGAGARKKRAVVAETYVEGETVNAWHVGIRSIPICCLAGASNTARRLNARRRIVVDQFYAGRHARLNRPPPSPTVAVAAPLIELSWERHQLRISGAVDPDLVAAVIKAMPRR